MRKMTDGFTAVRLPFSHADAVRTLGHPLARVLDTGPAELHGPCVKCLTAMLLASGPAFLVLDRALAPVLPSLTLRLHRVNAGAATVDATSNVRPTPPLVLTAVRGCR